jgi:hypothetical protein
MYIFELWRRKGAGSLVSELHLKFLVLVHSGQLIEITYVNIYIKVVPNQQKKIKKTDITPLFLKLLQQTGNRACGSCFLPKNCSCQKGCIGSYRGHTS